MKKSVIITIVAIYIISIFVVASLGINNSLAYETIYVTSIDGSNTVGYVETPDDKDGIKGKIVVKKENCAVGMEITLDFRPLPTNATKSKLKYSIESSSVDKCELVEQTDGTATLKVNKLSTIFINIASQDTKGYNIRVKIIFENDNEDW